MYHQDDINNMNYKQLRETVSELNDKYVKLKRTLEDALDNIDESNLATTLRKKLNGYDTQFSVTAEKIESKVSYEDLENSLNQYSTVSQTAQAIEMSVVSSQEYTDGSVEKLSSTFTMTADRISTRVTRMNGQIETKFEQTADAIKSLAFKKYDTSTAFTKSEKPTASNTTNSEKENLCKYNGKYYYFNSILQRWEEYSETNGVSSAFTQTADGFELNGCVKVSGDLITEGTIKGVDIQGAKFWGNNGENQYFKISSSFGDIGVFDKDASPTATVTNTKCAWGIYFPDPNNETFYMYSYGRPMLGYNHSQKKLYPMGTWDFSSCNVIGLPTTS